MTATEQTIWQTLVELDRQVKSMPTANPKPNLIPLFNELDELTQQLPSQTAPELLHYLRKKSYEKARLFLEGRDAENAAGEMFGADRLSEVLRQHPSACNSAQATVDAILAEVNAFQSGTAHFDDETLVVLRVL